MKYFSVLSALALLMVISLTSFGQITTAQVPGDDFSLEGALELFKQSESPEHFEQLLNSSQSKVNNLDLNGDGYTDYIRVFDRNDGNVHVFILQAVVSEYESQDVAVIELEKLDNGKAVLQIIGDEDIYGVETIIEPTRAVRSYAGTTTTNNPVNVWSWPVVYYVYSPYYATWNSSWGWHRRPQWWSSWRPVVYVDYYNYWRPYTPHYIICSTHRVGYAYNIYHPYRTTSVIVRNRHSNQIERYRADYGHPNNGNANGNTHRESRGSDRYDDRNNGHTESGRDHKDINRRQADNLQRIERGATEQKASRQNFEHQNNSRLFETSRGHTKLNENVSGLSSRQEAASHQRSTSHNNLTVQPKRETSTPFNRSQLQPAIIGHHENSIKRTDFNQNSGIKRSTHMPANNSGSAGRSGAMTPKHLKRGS